MDAETIGRAALLLGGGRQTTDDAIDFAVGLSRIKKIGEQVAAQEPLLFVHARTDPALASVLAASGFLGKKKRRRSPTLFSG